VPYRTQLFIHNCRRWVLSCEDEFALSKVVEAVNRARWLVVAGFLLLSLCAGAAQEIDWAGIIEAAKPAVVFIETNKSYGSGAIISPDGYILTAAHVIEGASWITVTVEDTREYRASVVQADYGMDVAVLKIPASGLTWLKLGDSDRLRYEDEIRVLGYPLPAPTGNVGVGFVAVAGRIQGFRQRASGVLLQHDAPTEGGHSGGPMIDARAEIVGVHVGFIPRAMERYKVAVAINDARRIIPSRAIPAGPSPVQPPVRPGVPTGPIRVPGDYSTISAALRAAPEGAEIHISRGTYRGDLLITKPLTISGESGAMIEGSVRITAAQAVAIAGIQIRGAVEIRDTTAFTLDRVTVAGSPGDGILIEASSGTITACTVQGAGGHGIIASFGSRITITHTTVWDSEKTGISLILNSQAQIRYCTVEGNGGDGIHIASSSADIRDNTVRNNQGWGIVATGGASVTPVDPAAANTLARNERGDLLGFGPARFVVAEISISPSPPFLTGTRATITATVVNVGGEPATKNVWLTVGGTKFEEMSLTLQPGQTETVSFTYEFSSSARVSVCSPDGCSGGVYVTAKPAVRFYVTAIYLSPTPLLPGRRATITVWVRNSGLRSGTRTIWCEVEGDRIGEAPLSLSPNEWRGVVFEHVFPAAGTYTIRVSTGDDTATYIASVLSSEHLRTLSGHGGYGWSVAFSPDGRLLASGSTDNTIKLWEVETGELVRTLSGHGDDVGSVAFSPDGRLLASGSGDKTVRFWSLQERVFPWPVGGIRSLAISASGERLAVGDQRSRISVWTPLSWTHISSIPGTADLLTLSPDGRLLAYATGAEITLWKLEESDVLLLSGHRDVVTALAFSPDGKLLLSSSADNTARLWDPATGELLHILTGHRDDILWATFSPEGDLLALASEDGTASLWSVTGERVGVLEGHTGTVWGLTFLEGGSKLATLSEDGTTRVWEVATGNLLGVVEAPPRSGKFAFTPDGRFLLLPTAAGLEVWDVEAGESIGVRGAQYGSATVVAASQELVAWGSEGAACVVWPSEEVLNRPPVADFAIPGTIYPYLEVVLDASASQDPDGQIVGYEWDLNGDGIYEINLEEAETRHRFPSPGSYEVTLRVTDDLGATAVASKVVEVAPVPGFLVLFDETRLLKRAEGTYEEGQGYDLAVGETAPYGASHFAGLLREQGYEVRALTQRPITPESLRGAAVLMILEPTVAPPYSPAEVEAIREFVEQGGGLFLASRGWRGRVRPAGGADPIARAFGVSFKGNGIICDSTDHYGLYLHVIEVSQLEEHWITNGVTSFYFHGTYLDELGDAEVIAHSDADSWFDEFGEDDWGDRKRQPDEEEGPFPVLAAMEFGKGRVVFAGNAFSILANDWIDHLDAERLALNIVVWLARFEEGNRPPTAEFTWEYLTSSENLCRFDGSPSADLDGAIVKYEWDWNSDGTFDISTTDPILEHRFPAGFPQQVTLRVTDDKGVTDEISLTWEEAATYWYELGKETLEVQGEPDQAVELLRKAIALHPGYVEALYSLGQALFASGHHQEALEAYEELFTNAETESWRVRARLMQAEIYLFNCNLDAAEAKLLEALDINPDYWYTHHRLGQLYKHQGRYQEAIAEFELAEEHGGSDVSTKLEIFACLLYQGAYQQATELIRSLSAEHPDVATLKNSLGWALFLQGEYEEARTLFEEVLSLTGEEGGSAAVAYNNLGCLYFMEGNWTQAIAAFERAQQVAPRPLAPLLGVELYTFLGLSYQQLGEPELAREAFSQAVSQGERILACYPARRDLHAELGFSYWGLGEEEKALEYLQRALDLSSGEAASDVIAQLVRKFLSQTP